MGLTDRVRQAWNAFRSTDDLPVQNYGQATYGHQSNSRRYSGSGEKTIITSIYTRIAIDVAAYEFKHVKVDDLGRYTSEATSRLNDALTIAPNLDQTPRQFRQDIVHSMFDNAVAAIIPIDTTIDPQDNTLFDIYSIRVGRVVSWYPEHVRVCVYNEKTGRDQEVTLPKSAVALVENPLAPVMNGPNSTYSRLVRKLSLLDAVDEAAGSGKLDMIIQLPYVVKSEAKKNQAETRLESIASQLKDSPLGIAYTDATEKIVQLNRPVENNLQAQVSYLVEMLYGQLGITAKIMNGEADEATMLNYENRTIEPILTSILEAMNAKFLGTPGQRKNEKIRYIRKMFRFVPMKDLADIVDKLSRNEIITPNEVRDELGLPPNSAPKSDMLQNSNMAPVLPTGEVASTNGVAPLPVNATTPTAPVPPVSTDVVNSAFDEVDGTLDDIFSTLGAEG